MLDQRRRRWSNIDTTLGQCPVQPTGTTAGGQRWAGIKDARPTQHRHDAAAISS